jgi:hypothetical protein
MHHHDGSNGARARSARIRAAHDCEATQLDSMRRRANTLEPRARRQGRWRALAATVARLTGRPAVYRAGDEMGVTEPADAGAGMP